MTGINGKGEQKAFSSKTRVRTMAHQRKVRGVKGGEEPDGCCCVYLRLATAFKGKGTAWTGRYSYLQNTEGGPRKDTGGEGVRGRWWEINRKFRQGSKSWGNLSAQSEL